MILRLELNEPNVTVLKYRRNFMVPGKHKLYKRGISQILLISSLIRVPNSVKLTFYFVFLQYFTLIISIIMSNKKSFHFAMFLPDPINHKSINQYIKILKI